MRKTAKHAAANLHAARHGKLRPSSSLRNSIKGLLTGILVLGLSLVSVAAYALLDISSKVTTIEPPKGTAKVEAPKTLEGELNVLLVGSDTRQGQEIDDGELGELNDVTMLLRISADHTRATVVSFPRDLMLSIPSCPGPNGEENFYAAMSEQQLNTTLQYGGLPCTVATIEELTGTTIPYAGLITFDGVTAMSNALGGVDVCLTQPIEDPNTELDLPAGEVTLIGKEALQFLRTRYGVGDGSDVSRISNQQVFMAAMMRQIRSSDTLGNPAKVYSLAKAAVENMTLYSNMASVEFMQAVAETIRKIDLENITFVQYPSYDHPYQQGRLAPNTVAGDELMARILSDQDFTIGGPGEGVDASATDPGTAADGSTGDTGGAATDPGADPNATGGAAGTASDGTGTAPVTDDVLADVTGQKASDTTCSGGRTR